MDCNIKNELECTVCVELFRNPRMLPCGHSFCLRCLETLASHNRSVTCPICRAKHQIPLGDVSKFSVNYSLQSLADDAAKSRDQYMMKPKCINHAEIEAVLVCKNCAQAVCPHCSAKHYTCQTMSKQPALVPLEVAKAELTNELASLRDKVARQLADLQDVEGTPDDTKKLKLAQKAAADEFTETVDSLEDQLKKLRQLVIDCLRASDEEVSARHASVKSYVDSLQQDLVLFSSSVSENLSDLSKCLILEDYLIKKLDSSQIYCRKQQSAQEIVWKFEEDTTHIRTALNEIKTALACATIKLGDILKARNRSVATARDRPKNCTLH